jgi:hypothetical protein
MVVGGVEMKMPEAIAALRRAHSLLHNPETIRAMREFAVANPDVDHRRCLALLRPPGWLAQTGLAAVASQATSECAKLEPWLTLLDTVLSHPLCYRDLADWWLFFAALEASTGFQLERCTARKREARLSGHLLEALAAQGKIWASVISGPVAQSGATLAIHEIDLETDGGEQETGADFGMILDFDGKTIQSGAKRPGNDHRIIPLLFQAKRYGRPFADVSQTNVTRGPQRTLLAGNSCASAYIFYENLGNPPTPLPPLVKPVANVASPNKTSVLEDSLDFATYLLQAAIDPRNAPRAASPDEALRMLFAKADPGNLSALVVISADPGITTRYRSSLDLLTHELGLLGDDDDHIPLFR